MRGPAQEQQDHNAGSRGGRWMGTPPFVRVALLATVACACPTSIGAGDSEGGMVAQLHYARGPPCGFVDARGCLLEEGCMRGRAVGVASRCDQTTAAHSARRQRAALPSLAAVAHGGNSHQARRFPEDRKWFVSSLGAAEPHRGGMSYFEETWGPVLEEARQKRNRSAAVGNPTPRSEQSAGGARERADSEPRPAGGARAAGASDAGDHVQAMLEAHSESDNDDSEGADMPWQNPYGPADHGPAPASSMPQGRNRRGSAPPARQDSERRGGAKEAPRCGPRGSVRGRAL